MSGDDSVLLEMGRTISRDEIERQFEMMTSEKCPKSIRREICYMQPGESTERLYDKFKKIK